MQPHAAAIFKFKTKILRVLAPTRRILVKYDGIWHRDPVRYEYSEILYTLFSLFRLNTATIAELIIIKPTIDEAMIIVLLLPLFVPNKAKKVTVKFIVRCGMTVVRILFVHQ